jgi:hypothetical protein
MTTNLVGQELLVEVGQKSGGISVYTGVLQSIKDCGKYEQFAFNGFTYTAQKGGTKSHRNQVYQSVDPNGQDIRFTVADLIGKNPRGLKPGLKLTANWTSPGVCPAIKWRGLNNGNWLKGKR